MALEGGYNLNSISYSMTMCAKALVGDRLPPIKPKEPLESAKVIFLFMHKFKHEKNVKICSILNFQLLLKFV